MACPHLDATCTSPSVLLHPTRSESWGRTVRLQVEREDDELEIRHLLVLEHLELQLKLLVQAGRKAPGCYARGDALLERADELVCARGDVLKGGEGHARECEPF